MDKPSPRAANPDHARIRLCIVINPAFGLLTCHGDQYAHLQARGYEVSAVAGRGDAEHAATRQLGVATFVVPMARYASPWRDLLSLIRMRQFFHARRFDVVLVSTPKASLLGLLGARLAGQRRLLYLVRGRAYECLGGARRAFYAGLDRLCCRLADVVVPVSESLRAALLAEGICPAGRLRMIGHGSSQGVDAASFAPTGPRRERAGQIRRELGLAETDELVLFVGWLRREKGVAELVEAVRLVRETRSGTHLLVLGDPHRPDDLPPATWRTLRGDTGFHWRELTPETAPYYLAADVVVLPSWREGLPRVVLEAGAAGRPVVTTDATGCRDSVVPGVTGLVVPVNNPEALAAAIRTLLEDPRRRAAMGSAAAEHVGARFSRAAVWDGTEELLRELAGRRRERGTP